MQVLERRVAKAPLTASDKLGFRQMRFLARSGGKSHFRTTDRIIGIGSSTGGTEAIKDVLRDLPPDLPGIVISPAYSRSV